MSFGGILFDSGAGHGRCDGGDFLTEVSDTNGIVGAADATLVLKRARDQTDDFPHVTGRDVDEAECASQFQSASETWHFLDGPVSDHAVGDTRARSAPTPALAPRTWPAH